MYDELKYWYLRDHKLFWTLSMSQIKQLCIITGFKKANKGDVIYFSSSDLPRIDLLVRNPTLALSYTKFVGLKMKRFKNNYSNLVSKDAKTRLSSFIKDWAEREGIQEGKKYTINNYLTQADIAQIICTSRQTATLLLKELEEKNIIYYNRKEIVIDNIEKL